LLHKRNNKNGLSTVQISDIRIIDGTDFRRLDYQLPKFLTSGLLTVQIFDIRIIDGPDFDIRIIEIYPLYLALHRKLLHKRNKKFGDKVAKKVTKWFPNMAAIWRLFSM
jgi:hypothetical protein